MSAPSRPASGVYGPKSGKVSLQAPPDARSKAQLSLTFDRVHLSQHLNPIVATLHPNGIKQASRCPILPNLYPEVRPPSPQTDARKLRQTIFVPSRYLNDFSKALASEVRILLQEVGKLRDERRALQQYVLSTLLASPQHPLTIIPRLPIFQRDRRADGRQSQTQCRRRVLPRLAPQGDLSHSIPDYQ